MMTDHTTPPETTPETTRDYITTATIQLLTQAAALGTDAYMDQYDIPDAAPCVRMRLAAHAITLAAADPEYWRWVITCDNIVDALVAPLIDPEHDPDGEYAHFQTDREHVQIMVETINVARAMHNLNRRLTQAHNDLRQRTRERAIRAAMTAAE